MKNYEELKLEVVRFKSADVVTASGTRPPAPPTQDDNIRPLQEVN